jgi:hypothetical protein
MLANPWLIVENKKIKFVTEKALENFVYLHLQELLDCQPFKCQYAVAEESGDGQL